MNVLALLVFTLCVICVSTQRDKKVDLNCIRFCSINHHPVCASNGECIYEFKNKCTLNNQNCEAKKKTKREFKSIYIGLCYKPENPCHPEDITAE